MANLPTKLLMADGSNETLHAGDFSYLNYIDFTPSVAASDSERQVFTVSFWVKPDTLADLAMFSASPFEGATSPRFNFWTNSSGQLRFHFNFTGSSWQYFQSAANTLVANQWQHIHIQFDARESSNSDRLKIYRNSKRVALPTFGTVPFNLGQGCVGNNVPHGIGVNIYRPTDTNKQFDGQIVCFNLCIGNIYNVESFCNIDTENEIMTPILEPTVVYGTNGFRVTQAKRIEKDLSGNGNDFTVRGNPTAVEIDDSTSISAIVSMSGQQEFTSVGTTNWVVPEGVSLINVVAVGGGGGGSASTSSSNGFSGGGGGGGALAWKNNISVTSGETLSIFVGAGGNGGSFSGNNNASDGGDSGVRRGSTYLVRAGGGFRGTYNSASRSSGGSPIVYDGGGSGGQGGGGQNGNESGGGGGAGGYSGNGGDGGTGTGAPTSGSGGGGGGHSGTNAFTSNVTAGGGGVGLLGEGASGSAVDNASGTVGANAGSGGVGKIYGGGGSGAEDDSGAGGASGGQGAVRIIWGSGRAYPSTNTLDE